MQEWYIINFTFKYLSQNNDIRDGKRQWWEIFLNVFFVRWYLLDKSSLFFFDMCIYI